MLFEMESSKKEVVDFSFLLSSFKVVTLLRVFELKIGLSTITNGDRRIFCTSNSSFTV